MAGGQCRESHCRPKGWQDHSQGLEATQCPWCQLLGPQLRQWRPGTRTTPAKPLTCSDHRAILQSRRCHRPAPSQSALGSWAPCLEQSSSSKEGGAWEGRNGGSPHPPSEAQRWGHGNHITQHSEQPTAPRHTLATPTALPAASSSGGRREGAAGRKQSSVIQHTPGSPTTAAHPGPPGCKATAPRPGWTGRPHPW